MEFGERFGRLMAVKFVQSGRWEFRCDCGTFKYFNIYNVSRGKTQSCGCLQKERAHEARYQHGLTKHPAYRTWAGMSNRCNNPNAEDYRHYGGRGITICGQWRTFLGFWNDMKATWQDGLKLERLDNDGNYEPSNCSWASQKEQVRNRRNSRVIDTPWGRMSAAEAAERANLPYSTFIQRVRANWPYDRLFAPMMRQKIPK